MKTYNLLILYLLILYLLAAIVSCQDKTISNSSKINEATEGPVNIRLGTTHNTLHGVTLIWNSSNPNDSVKWGYSTDYEFGKFSGERFDKQDRYLYLFTFSALKPLSWVHYSIKSVNNWIEDRFFRTSVDTIEEHFSFIVGGDSHAGDSEFTNERWKKISRLISQEDFDFFIHLGDATDDNDVPSQWTILWENGKNLFEKKIAFFTWGNHEYGELALNNAVLPENEKWYSFVQGNALFICLLSEEDFEIQYQWLLQQLETQKKEWIFVYFHRPFFTRGKHKDEMNDLRETWWKAFDDYGVDVVMSGHTHSYIRTVPINLNISDSSAVSQYGSKSQQGRMEFVSGGLGGKNSSACEEWFAAAAYSGMNYIKFQINGNKLLFTAFDENGTVIDSLTIYSEGAKFQK